MGDGRRGRFPSQLTNMVPCPEATIRPPQYKTLFRNTSDFIDELGDALPPPNAWMAPVVEDMLQEARAGLTEAVVIGPGRAILFYGRRSMGEGLKVDEARDAAFLLTSTGTWVGKSAYLTTDPMTIQEGRRAIAEAISDNRVKAREPGHPRVNPPAQQPFKFNTPRASQPGDVFIHCSSDNEREPRQPSRGRWDNRI